METFEYSVIRYVPRVEREEFINVGVILFSKRKKYLGVHYKIDRTKICAIGEEDHVSLLEDYLRSWEMICSGGQDGGPIARQEMPYRFRWLTASRSTIIQASRPHPGRTDKPAEVLMDLFRKYVD